MSAAKSETPQARPAGGPTSSGRPEGRSRRIARVDVRGPRFGAWITSVLLAVVIFLGPSTRTGTTLGERVADPAFILLVVAAVLFGWGAFAGLPRHPYSILFRRVVLPRLHPTTETEDVRPPTFAQLVGFVMSAVGIVLALGGVPWGLVAAAAAAFIAAFLNASIGLCLGCQLYLLGARIRARAQG